MRAFLASALPDALHDQLASLIAGLDHKVPEGSVRWVKPENIHLTLKFLGDISSDQSRSLLETARPLVEARPHFGLGASGLGVFPNSKRPNVIWVGIEAYDRSLTELHSALEHSLARIGFEAESRPFHPHLTLGRARRDLGRHDRELLAGVLSEQQVGHLGEWEVRSLVLMRSDLRPDGPHYTPIETLQLKDKTG